MQNAIQIIQCNGKFYSLTFKTCLNQETLYLGHCILDIALTRALVRTEHERFGLDERWTSIWPSDR